MIEPSAGDTRPNDRIPRRGPLPIYLTGFFVLMWPDFMSACQDFMSGHVLKSGHRMRSKISKVIDYFGPKLMVWHACMHPYQLQKIILFYEPASQRGCKLNSSRNKEIKQMDSYCLTNDGNTPFHQDRIPLLYNKLLPKIGLTVCPLCLERLWSSLLNQGHGTKCK